MLFQALRKPLAESAPRISVTRVVNWTNELSECVRSPRIGHAAIRRPYEALHHSDVASLDKIHYYGGRLSGELPAQLTSSELDS
jgi:hypothetical protein